ncbi:MAG: class I SAM-dependent methyltransferase [Caulobacteraceae bacterium]|nr:class I SAM-dependent methyltransferase [Caulobacteraceae bacterium]
MTAFTSDWHSYTIPVWERVVLPAIKQGRRRFLELGSYEGRSATWLINNALGDSGELTCVDHWHDERIERMFAENTAGRAVMVKSDITKAILSFIQAKREFDCIYIDGNHDGRVVLENAVLSWMLLPHGGVIVFDDYRYAIPQEHSFGSIDTKEGIDAFLQCYCLKMRVLHKSAQVVVVKEA